MAAPDVFPRITEVYRTAERLKAMLEAEARRAFPELHLPTNVCAALLRNGISTCEELRVLANSGALLDEHGIGPERAARIRGSLAAYDARTASAQKAEPS